MSLYPPGIADDVPNAGIGAQPSGVCSSSLFRKTGWSAVATVTWVSSRFVTSVAVARLLGPKGVGELAYLMWLAEAVSTLTNLGVQFTVTRFVAELHGQARPSEAVILVRWLYLRYLARLALGALVLGAIGTLSRDRSATSAVWLCLAANFVLQGMAAFYIAYLAGQQRFDVTAWLNAVASIALVLGVTAGTLLFGMAGALVGYAAGTLPHAALSLRLISRTRSHAQLGPELRRRCLKYGMFTWLAVIVSAFVWSRVEIFFLNRYWDTQTIAMFTVGLTLAALATQGPMLLCGPLLAHLSERRGAGDVNAIRRTFATATRLLALMLFPLSFGLASITSVLLPFLYGNAFRPAVPSAMVLIAFSALAFANVGASVVHAMERSWFIALGGLAGAVLSLTGCMLVIPAWGAWGAVWSRAAVQSSMIALGLWYIFRHLSCPIPLLALAKTLSAALLSAGVSYSIVSLASKPALALTLAVPAGALAYLIAVRHLKIVQPDDLRLLERTLEAIPVRFSAPVARVSGWLTAERP